MLVFSFVTDHEPQNTTIDKSIVYEEYTMYTIHKYISYLVIDNNYTGLNTLKIV